jgi:hypothetical protein
VTQDLPKTVQQPTATRGTRQQRSNTLLRSGDCCGSSAATDTAPPTNRTTGDGAIAPALSAAATAARDTITTAAQRVAAAAAASLNKRQRRRFNGQCLMKQELPVIDENDKDPDENSATWVVVELPQTINSRVQIKIHSKVIRLNKTPKRGYDPMLLLQPSQIIQPRPRQWCQKVLQEPLRLYRH